jgi:hypothetical protein
MYPLPAVARHDINQGMSYVVVMPIAGNCEGRGSMLPIEKPCADSVEGRARLLLM